MGEQLPPLTERTVHLCVDMQRIFTPDRFCDIENGVQGYTGRQSSGPGI